MSVTKPREAAAVAATVSGTGAGPQRERMKIELLYIEGCPNHRPAMERVASVLNEMGIAEAIYAIPVATIEQARTLVFPSPFASTMKILRKTGRA
jgi:hypothetical protein